MQAYQKCGLPQAPGMEISYVVKDARMWEVDPERTALEFDPCYVIEHDPCSTRMPRGWSSTSPKVFTMPPKRPPVLLHSPGIDTFLEDMTRNVGPRVTTELISKAYPRTQELSHRIFAAETLMQVLHNQTQQAEHNPTEDYRKSHIEDTYGRRFLPAEFLGQSENRGQAGDV